VPPALTSHWKPADIALMAGQLAKLPVAITLARKAARIIRQNIGLSLATIAALDTAP
jgi:cation transport ATPase